MEMESFEDEKLLPLNKDFVAIKVDKEERPDLDMVYGSMPIVYRTGRLAFDTTTGSGRGSLRGPTFRKKAGMAWRGF